MVRAACTQWRTLPPRLLHVLSSRHLLFNPGPLRALRRGGPGRAEPPPRGHPERRETDQAHEPVHLEHGGEDQSTEHYETVAYWYAIPASSLIKTDVLAIADAGSEAAHQ